MHAGEYRSPEQLRFKFVFNDNNPKKADSLTLYADGDVSVNHAKYVSFTSPDNIETSTNSLMVQEDADFG